MESAGLLPGFYRGLLHIFYCKNRHLDHTFPPLGLLSGYLNTDICIDNWIENENNGQRNFTRLPS